MSERRVTTTINLSGCRLPLLILTGVPAVLLIAALIAQQVIYG